MNLDPAELQALAREIAVRMAPDALLDSEDVAAYLKCSARYVTAFYAITPGFPKSIRLPGPEGGKGQRRWPRSEIVAWAALHRDGKTKRGGRPRKTLPED